MNTFNKIWNVCLFFPVEELASDDDELNEDDVAYVESLAKRVKFAFALFRLLCMS